MLGDGEALHLLEGLSMSWLRIDDGFASHPKIAALTDREFRIWMRTLCYCARAEDPTIDPITCKEIPHLTPKLVSKWHQLSLVDRVGNAYEIHDWVKYQPADKTGAERQARYRARRLKQAKPPRDATVTDVTVENELSTVTPAVTKSSPSRARAARPVSTKPHSPTTANYAWTSDLDLERPFAPPSEVND